jgi:hypothetical protein
MVCHASLSAAFHHARFHPRSEILMRSVFNSFTRAMLSQLSWRMLWLTVVPFLLSLAFWGVALWLGLQPMIDWIQTYFVSHDGFRIAGGALEWVGLGAIRTVIVPLIAMWILLPLMIITALLFIGLFAMPAIEKHVSGRYYPQLEFRRGGSMWGTVWVSFYSFMIFLLLWIATLPLSVIPPLGFVIQPALWGWLTYRVMGYEALAAHADPQEIKSILRTRRWPMLVIGSITGLMGAAPTLLCIGGVLSVVFFPMLAALSIWLYVLVFVFTGLWFQHFCLEALARHRTTALPASSLQEPNDFISVL